jgi:hypothetical protein
MRRHREPRLRSQTPRKPDAPRWRHSHRIESRGGPKIERLFEWEFLIWAREELRKKYGVSSSALSATQAREQLKGHGYRIWWSVLSGYKVQIPSVHNLEQ